MSELYIPYFFGLAFSVHRRNVRAEYDRLSKIIILDPSVTDNYIGGLNKIGNSIYLSQNSTAIIFLDTFKAGF